MANINMTQGQLDSVVTAINNRAKTTDVNNGLATKVAKVTSTDNAIVRFDGTTGAVQNSSVIVDDSGNVGIGGASQQVKLEVLVADSLGSSGDGIVVRNGTSPKQAQLSRTGSGYNYLGVVGEGSLIYSYDKLRIAADTNQPITFHTGGDEKVKIDSAGNVGIGTGSPSGKLSIAKDVSGATTYSTEHLSIINNQAGAVGNEATLGFHLNNASWGGDTTYARVSAKLENASTGATSLVFGTASNGSLATPAERMRIDSAGNVGINTTSNLQKLSVKGDIGLIRDTSFHGEEIGATIKVTSSAVGYSDGSDLVFSTMAGDNVDGGTVSERMRIDSSGNVGVGVTPSAWNPSWKVIETGTGSLVNPNTTTNMILCCNTYYDTSWKYKNTGSSTLYSQDAGRHIWYSAVSGTAGNAITWTTAMILNANGELLLTSGTGALGYGTGAGGTVTQLTSKSTAVTLNKPTGLITMNNASLAAGGIISFNMNNSVIGANDIVIPNIIGGTVDGSSYTLSTTYVSTGVSRFRLKNETAGSLSDTLLIQFIIIKGATA